MDYNLSYVVNSLFFKRENYKNIPIKDKDKSFFIVNRFLSKMFPYDSQRFNKKSIDKSLALDMWFIYLRNVKKRETFETFWKKNDLNNENKYTFKKKDIKLLKDKLELTDNDFDFLYRFYKKYLKEELNYYNKLN